MNTTYFLNKAAGILFSNSTQTVPNYYIGLSTTTPTVSGTGATEPSGNGYARVRLTSFSAASGGVVKNSANIAFPAATAGWGTITHVVIYDAATSGNLLMYYEIPEPRTVNTAQVLTILKNTLTLKAVNVS